MKRVLKCFTIMAVNLLLFTAACGGPGATGNDGAPGDQGPVGQQGPAGQQGPEGQQGPTGPQGPAGADGATGAPGAPGRDGLGAALIIAMQPDDQLGTDNDKSVRVTFGNDVNNIAQQLNGASIILSYSHRTAPKLLEKDDACAAILERPDTTCFINDKGERKVVVGRDQPLTGFLEPGTIFPLVFDRPMALDTFQVLEDVLNAQLGRVDIVHIIPPMGVRRDFTVLVMQRIPVLRPDATGKDLGRVLTIPAFALRDAMGNGNEFLSFTLLDTMDTEVTQKEPKGMPFEPNMDILVDTVREDGLFNPESRFYLRFDQLMEPLSTAAAIRSRLMALPGWGEVMVDADPMASFLFVVTVLELVDLRSSNGQSTLTLEKWDVTSAAGISNSNEPITFIISETRAPELVTLNDGNTMQVILAANTPVRSSNNQLVGGDVLQVNFTEPMDVTARVELAERISALPNVGAIVPEAINILGNTYMFTLNPGDSIDIPGDTLELGALATTVKDANGINLAPAQNPSSKKSSFMVAPLLSNPHPTDTLYTDTVYVELDPASQHKDHALEAGDTLFFQFDASMDMIFTRAGLAQLIATGPLTGGARSGTFLTPNVNAAIVPLSAGPLSNARYAYTLVGDQKIQLADATLVFGALPPSVVDIHGRHIAANQAPSIRRENVDPTFTPILKSVRVERGVNSLGFQTPCGDALLEEGDVISFIFSELLHPLQLAPVSADIAAKLTAQATGTVSAVDVTTLDGIKFDARIPTSVTMTAGTARTFVLDPTLVKDVYQVAAANAQDVTGTLEPVDVLKAEMDSTQQFVRNDGMLDAGDMLRITWNCTMDRWETLSAIQKAVDTLMGDGTARVTPASSRVHVVEILPGHRFAAATTRTLQVGPVVTDEAPDNMANPVAHVAGPIPLTFDDSRKPDVQLTLVPGSIQGSTALFRAVAAIPTGTWFLSTVSSQMTRATTDLHVVFGDFDAPQEVPAP